VKLIQASYLARREFKANPYPFYARLREEAPVCLVKAFHIKAWLVTRYDDVLTVLKDERFAKDITSTMRWLPGFARPLTQHMLNRDPPDHTRLRALATKAFTPVRVEKLRSRIEQVCEELLGAAPRNEPFDLLRGYALPIPLTVIADLLGIPERDRFHSLVRGSLPLAAPTGVMDIPVALAYFGFLIRYIRKLLADRRGCLRDDLVGALVEAEEAGDRLNEGELLGTVILLLSAGYETTVNLIASGALALLQDPGQRELFARDPAVAEAAIEELLRFTSPVEIVLPRLAREEVTLASVTIPRGELVAAVLGSANRDESKFPDPDTLNLTREPNKHLAFGQGAHFCLGAQLARLEGQIALTTLFRRFPNLRLAQPAEKLRWRKLLPLRGLEALPVLT